MKKKVIVIYYSQSGQLKDILNNMLKPLQENKNIDLTFYPIKPKNDFKFPWSKKDFFNAFPETFQQIPAEIEEPDSKILETKYDLVILAYQVWYLSPSIPINSFLKSPFSAQILRNTPVVTVSGSRNMWIMAQEKIKTLLNQNTARLVGNIALVDRHINLISVITIVDWMFSGIKRKKYGFLPFPGVSDEDIKKSFIFGKIILRSLEENNYELLQNNLVLNNAVEIKHFLVSIDKKANRMFYIWSKIILRNTYKRSFLLRLFNYYLFFAIWFLSPIVHLIHTLLYPLMYFKIKKEEKYFQGIK